MSDYYDESGIHSPEGYGAPERKNRDGLKFLLVVVPILVIIIAVVALVLGGEDEAAVGPPLTAPSPPAPTSFGITQAQLDRLGDSIEARYASGDTEVAEALLRNFMNAHPECISAVMAGGEGRMRDVLAQSEQVAKYLKSTGPRPDTYTTVITTKNEGVVKAAVLGVSCEEGA